MDIRQVEKELAALRAKVAELEKHTGKIPVRFGGGGGGGGSFSIDTVTALPAIPSSGCRIVLGSTGKNLWFSAVGLTRWYPMVFASGNATTGAGFGAVGDTV